MYKIILKKDKFIKAGRRWVLSETSAAREITHEQYNNITNKDTLKFFRGLGGREIVKRAYTFAGYVPVNIDSISPNGQEKSVYKFTFEKI